MSTMSFVDLATLALHRRHEMEARINVFATKCDQAMNDIAKLKLHAKNFVHQLNCEPSELKERFLNCMKQLDEYIYLITDFTLSIENLGTDSIEYCPVLDTGRKPLQPLPAFNFNIMDVLSEPAPSTSTACPNLCPIEKPQRKKVPKEEQSLIVFSSASCSSESVPARAEKHVQCEMMPDHVVTAVDKMTITDIPSTTTHGPTSSSNGRTSSSHRRTSSSDRLTLRDRVHNHGLPRSESDVPVQGPTSSQDPLGPASSDNPVLTSKGPTSTLASNGPTSTSNGPRSTTNRQSSTTKGPTSTTKGPTSTTNRQSSTTKGPTSTTKGPTSTTKGPTSTTNGSTLTSNGPTSSPDGPTSAGVAASDCNLPAQTLLQTDQVYQAIIMHVDGAAIWIITEDPGEVYKDEDSHKCSATEADFSILSHWVGPLLSCTADLTSYCKENRVKMTPDDIKSLTLCAFYDEEGDHYYRGLFLRLVELKSKPKEKMDQIGVAEVFLVDTGEVRYGSVACLQPLPAAFCARPPYARCAHLAGVELAETEEAMEKYEEFLKRYVGAACSVEVDDNTSESLGVYMLVDSEWLHEAVVAANLARATDATPAACSIRNVDPKRTLISGPAELALSDELDDNSCPEYEDPEEAVTGHRYRDEADICKHYTGGPERACFKGARCTKRHVMKHPDGWTLDRVEVPVNVPAAFLPAPGTWHRVTVTCVPHFNRLYAHFKPDKEKLEELPSFGVVVPPASLDALVRDMNSPATRVMYKPLTLRPAPGELVAAKYPLDDKWYRARVLIASRADQNIEVIYIDYGNVMWVKEDAVSTLEPRYCVLPAQATNCVLAGAAARDNDSKLWARAKQELDSAVLNRTLDAHIIARGFDEVTVELLDEQGYQIADQLAAKGLITLKEYEVIDDTNVKQKLTVP